MEKDIVQKSVVAYMHVYLHLYKLSFKKVIFDRLRYFVIRDFVIDLRLLQY